MSAEAEDRVRELLEKVSEALGLDAGVVVEEDDEGGIRGTLEGDDLGLFIGRHGQTIDAVQHLAFKIANRDAARDAAVRVTVDAAGYRERREQMLHRQADQAAGARRALRPPGGAGRDERDRAQGRARAPEGPRRRRDVLRGHRARPAPRRRAASLGAFHVPLPGETGQPAVVSRFSPR